MLVGIIVMCSRNMFSLGVDPKKSILNEDLISSNILDPFLRPFTTLVMHEQTLTSNSMKILIYFFQQGFLIDGFPIDLEQVKMTKIQNIIQSNV